jgi:hypothetical protein
MTLFLISAFFFALAGYGIYLRGKYTSSSECSRYARFLKDPMAPDTRPTQFLG